MKNKTKERSQTLSLVSNKKWSDSVPKINNMIFRTDEELDPEEYYKAQSEQEKVKKNYLKMQGLKEPDLTREEQEDKFYGIGMKKKNVKK